MKVAPSSPKHYWLPCLQQDNSLLKSDLSKALKIMASRAEHEPDWAASYSEGPGLYIRALEQFKFSSLNNNLSEKAFRNYCLIRDTFSALFPPQEPADCAVLAFNNERVATPENLLGSRSSFFRDILATDQFEAERREIILDEPFMTNALFDHFKTFLFEGKIEINIENIKNLIQMARHYQLRGFSQKCIEQIMKQFDVDQLRNLLLNVSWAKNDFNWACLTVLCRMSEESLSELLNFPITTKSTSSNKLQKIRQLVELAKEIKKAGIEIGFSESNLRMIKITNSEEVTNALLHQIRSIAPIESLYANCHSFSHAKLDLLTLPNLRELELRHNKELKKIPEDWLKNLETLICVKCDALEGIIEVPKARNVHIKYCEKLCHLVAPNAKSVSCKRCPWLDSLETPEAVTINCKFCKRLEQLNAGKAKYINLRNCSLDILDVPNAVTISCLSCKDLAVLKAPVATFIDCFICPSLHTVIAPNARKVYCSECQRLKILDASLAESISLNKCDGLRELQAPSARSLSCYVCFGLTSIIAPQANAVTCTSCHNLKNIDAPTAKDIKINSCYKLFSLDIPNAEKILCNGTMLHWVEIPNALEVEISNSPLWHLKAPRAAIVKCKNCSGISRIKAPIAHTIELEGNMGLKTLFAPQVETLNLIDFKAFRFNSLNAAQAKVVKCHKCPDIVEIIADHAVSIDCEECGRLKSLTASQAKNVKIIRCGSLKKLNAPNGIFIDCSGCRGLICLDAPNAETIICEGCEDLFVILAPKANGIDYSYREMILNYDSPNIISNYCYGELPLDYWILVKAGIIFDENVPLKIFKAKGNKIIHMEDKSRALLIVVKGTLTIGPEENKTVLQEGDAFKLKGKNYPVHAPEETFAILIDFNRENPEALAFGVPKD